jgi:hypothetical protein
MVALQGLLDPEAGQTLVAALEPLARPANADDDRSGGQRRADALVELARRTLESGQLPQTGGVRPQLLVTVDLDSLLGHGGLGGEVGGAWPLDPETCRRLACDGAVTRVLVARHPTNHHHHGSGGDGSLAALLRAAATRLPATLGGCPGPSRWRWAGPAGSCRPPSGSPWWSATAVVRWWAVSGLRPGVRPIIWSTGCMAARRIWRTWSCCAGLIIGRCTRAGGGWAATPTAG